MPPLEGVALYRCLVGEIGVAVCGRTAEGRVYLMPPICHGRPMALVGYDWDRELPE